MNEILPCPSCGSTPEIEDYSHPDESCLRTRIGCCYVTVQGWGYTYSEAEQDVIKQWNELDRGLKWTRGENNPIPKGFYFTRPHENIGIFRPDDVLVEHFCGERRAFDFVDIAGPIPMPREV